MIHATVINRFGTLAICQILAVHEARSKENPVKPIPELSRRGVLRAISAAALVTASAAIVAGQAAASIVDGRASAEVSELAAGSPDYSGIIGVL